MLWSYFGSGHGKGEHDGAGAILKRAPRAAESSPTAGCLQSAADVVEYLRNNISGAAATSHMSGEHMVHRSFWLIGKNEVNRRNKYGCDPIPGSKMMHSLYGCSVNDPTQLMMQSLTCFCVECIQSNHADCETVPHSVFWKPVALRPHGDATTHRITTQVSAESSTRLPSAGIDSIACVDDTDVDVSQLADALEIGDNFLVLEDRKMRVRTFTSYAAPKQRTRFEWLAVARGVVPPTNQGRRWLSVSTTSCKKPRQTLCTVCPFIYISASCPQSLLKHANLRRAPLLQEGDGNSWSKRLLATWKWQIVCVKVVWSQSLQLLVLVQSVSLRASTMERSMGTAHLTIRFCFQGRV